MSQKAIITLTVEMHQLAEWCKRIENEARLGGLPSYDLQCIPARDLEFDNDGQLVMNLGKTLDELEEGCDDEEADRLAEADE